MRYRNRRFFLSPRDVRNGRWLCELFAERREQTARGQAPPRLMTAKAMFRRISNGRRVSGLLPFLGCEDPEMVRMAIWLLSRIHLDSAIWAIKPFRYSTDVRVRREVARALRRLGAWAELRPMAADDDDPRVKRLATPTPPRPLEARLARMARSIESLEHAPAPPQSWFSPGLVWGPGRPARTAEFIRAVLQRIHQLVRGT